MMPALPPLQLSASSSATATAKGGDGAFGGSGAGVKSGDWNVSYGTGNASSAAGVNWLYIALAAGAFWWIKTRG